jgi:hypothetical protein
MTTAVTSSDNSTELIVVEEDKCSTKIGSAGMGFPREDRTECELEDWNDCEDLREDLRAAGDGKTWGVSWMTIVSIDQLSRKLYVPG